MLSSILIGLDGSAYSDVAVELGIQWAKKLNALLVGLGIVDEPTICKREPLPVGGASYKHERDEQLLADGRHKVEEFLERFGTQCAAAGVAYQELEDVGMPYDEILRQSHRYDLVLLGHETHFHFETSDRADETLWHVLRSESRPVVVARQAASGPVGGGGVQRQPAGGSRLAGIPDLGFGFRRGSPHYLRGCG